MRFSIAPIAALACVVAMSGTAIADDEPGWLGIFFQPARGGSGVVVISVVRRSPADGAGLKVGAVITDVDGQPIGGAAGFDAFLKAAKAGQSIQLGFEVDGKQQTAKITLVKKDVVGLGEIALDDAAKWLVSKQLPDGGWLRHMAPQNATDTSSALTALAARILAELPAEKRKPHEPAIEKAVQFLLARATTDGKLGMVHDASAPSSSTYESYATAETLICLHALDAKKYEKEIAALRDALVQRQLGRDEMFFSLDWQFGAWPFESAPVEGRNDVRASVGPTAIALEALWTVGLNGANDAFKYAHVYLERAQNWREKREFDALQVMTRAYVDGGFPDSPRASKAGPRDFKDPKLERVFRSYGSTTADGARALICCGEKVDSPRVKAAIDWLAKHLVLDRNPGFDEVTKEGGNQSAFDRAIYFYYLGSVSRAFELAGAAEVQGAARVHKWPLEMIELVGRLQNPDGSFKNAQFGMMNEDNEVVATSFAMMALECSLRMTAKK